MAGKYDEYKALRLAGSIPVEARRSVGVSNGASYQYEQRLRADIGLAYDSLQGIRSRRALKAAAYSRATVIEVERRPCPLAQMPSYHYGYLAEDFIYYQLRRRGYEVHRPAYPIPGTDLSVHTPSRVFRCEVKSTTSAAGVVSFKRSVLSKNKGSVETRAYLPEQVDVFFAVDLALENVLVIPADQMPPLGTATVSSSGDFWRYKDDYSVFDIFRHRVAMQHGGGDEPHPSPLLRGLSQHQHGHVQSVRTRRWVQHADELLPARAAVHGDGLEAEPSG